MGTVAILENKHLCFAESINWTKIRRSKEHLLMLSNNSDPATCKIKGLVCDRQCSSDGCWGAKADQCLSCAHFKLAGQCLQNCSILPGIYRAEHNECRHCHEECGSFCMGPGANHCKSCKNFRDGPFCVPKCPANKFADSNNFCQHCSSTCVDGCTGSKNIVGPGGCNSCEFAILYENATTPVCLQKNDSCPERYFLEYVDPLNNDGQKPLEVKGVCRKCHRRCTKCSGFGFHTSVCKCASFKKGEQCEDECVLDHYPDIATHECIPCDSECRGCTGPGPENCITCHNFKIYDNNSVDVNKTFRCVESCSIEFPHRIVPEKGDAYCSEKPNIPIVSARSQVYIVTTTACVIAGVLVILMVTALVFYCQRKEKLKENAMKMTMALTGLEDNVPLRQSNVLPNFAKLRIIKETELRKGDELGHGAFGTVYKGYWVIDDPQPVGKIPVAIKVLRDGGANTSKEFLSEAYIMATVDHPNLLQLLAVCMTSKMMLITQLMPLGCLLDFVRKNKDRVGSKALLNWSTQIARGMAYLEEKRLVHRDLAARNVLVQSPAVVKITDFGLAKLLDTNEEEYKAEGGKMPIKWLALECIQHRIFTHKSDVWAFGVTVWELLTFGGKPYDKIPARNVPEILEKGERLPQPSIATIDVYVILIKCWMLDAESRPSFKELEDEFGKMVRDPGRYLVIPGDRFMRLHLSGTPQSDRDMVRSLASAMENSETSELDEYFQAKSRAPLHPSLSSTGSSPLPDKFWPSTGQQISSDGSASGFHNTQNHLNQRLLRYNQSVNLEPPPRHMQPDSRSLRHNRDSLKEIGADEYDSGRSQAQVGPLKLELPFDEDDYLVPLPSTQPPMKYLDVIDPGHEDSLANVLRSYSDFYRNNIDNPEYLMSTDTASMPCQQTVGLPTVSELVHASTSEPSTPGLHKPFYIPQKSCEEESDHEYYNEIDRLQRELQPLHKSKHEGAMV